MEYIESALSIEIYWSLVSSLVEEDEQLDRPNSQTTME